GKTITASGAFTYVPTENKSLSIVGANYHSTTLSGGNANPVLVIDTTTLSSDDAADVTLKNVTVENGTGTDFGGGLGATTVDADLTVESCRFRNNTTSSNSGGAGLLSFGSGNITVTNSIFSENSAGGSGGLRVDSSSGTITVANNTFSHNNANGIVGSGGLNVGARDGAALITGNIFDGNAYTSGGGGAAVVVNGSGVCTFTKE